GSIPGEASTIVRPRPAWGAADDGDPRHGRPVLRRPSANVIRPSYSAAPG
ncbi:MAG: hypothetical protein JWQ36_3200, partial [Enterovirga sp.]|nr:hypothetical protein [Enterovirga sp.]